MKAPLPTLNKIKKTTPIINETINFICSNVIYQLQPSTVGPIRTRRQSAPASTQPPPASIRNRRHSAPTVSSTSPAPVPQPSTGPIRTRQQSAPLTRTQPPLASIHSQRHSAPTVSSTSPAPVSAPLTAPPNQQLPPATAATLSS